MRWASLAFLLAAVAAAIFIPPVLRPLPTEVRCLHADGRDQPCPPEFARAVVPERTRPSASAFTHDFALAAAEAGPEGCGWLLGGLAALAMFLGLWTGLRCALRRGLVVLAVGLPVCLGLLYHSCFLDGRGIELGPEAADYVPCSLHTQTNRTTGIVSPKHVVLWHVKRGFKVINISDKDDTSAGAAARAALKGGDAGVLVIVGEEWHGNPHMLLVRVERTWSPKDTTVEELLRGVHADGGAAFVAHPWSHLPEKRSVDDFLRLGADGVEAVNGVIRGSDGVLATTLEHGKALLGTVDYKYGPHVTAMTLLPASVVAGPGGTPTVEGVVKALRTGQTKVLYAVPGGARTGEAYRAGELGLVPAKAALRSLLEVPRGRRFVWFLWLAILGTLWLVATLDPKSDARMPRLSPRTARSLLLLCALGEFALMALLSWKVKRVVVVPVPIVLLIAGVLAVPLLAATIALGRAERAA